MKHQPPDLYIESDTEGPSPMQTKTDQDRCRQARQLRQRRDAPRAAAGHKPNAKA